jgi:predicted lipoprotein with Yx(FWY)xxD motif
MRRFLISAALVLAGAGSAFASPVLTIDTDLGKVLAGQNGMTLYVFKKDQKGVSNCYDDCAKYWPPYVAAAGAAPEGNLTLVARKDGSMQWAKDGMPLYFWTGDQEKGDTTGNGVQGVWLAAKP